MKSVFRILLLVATLATSYRLHAQQNVTYSHYYLNPFLYNPSFAATNGYSELYLNYRDQWSGLEGAPTTGMMSLQLPLNSKAGIAFTGLTDKAGVLNTSTGLVTFAYQVYLGNSVNDEHKIAFGLSAGATSHSIRPDDSYANDPAVGTTNSFEGQFGMHYQNRNLKIAAAFPRLQAGVEHLRNTISSVSYTIQLGDRIEVEPMVAYRTYDNTSAQAEALGLLRIDKLVWVGASYRQHYGATALGGFNYRDKLKLAYAYDFASAQLNALGGGTHEIQLVLRFGKKKQVGKQAKHQQVQPVQKLEVEKASGDTEIHEKEERMTMNNETESRGDTEQVVEPSEEVSEINSNVRTSDQQHEVENTKRDAEVHDGEKSVATNNEAESSDDAQQVEQSEVKSEVNSSVEANDNGNGIPSGYYVVVGAFRLKRNANNYVRDLRRSGYSASVIFQSGKNLYIVYVENAPTIDKARLVRDKYRQISQYSFPDTWILSVPE